jgi:ribonuclease D
VSEPIQSVDQESSIERIDALARAAGRFAIDTEFLPEGRYRPLLCLVQIAVDDEIFLLDPLVGFDHAPLAALIADPEIEVVLHAGRQDVAILRREWKTDFENLFDTQVAAGFAGFSAQAGYTGLLNDVLGIRVAKSASFTRWDRRPLTDEQTKYAREDVEHLLELASELQNRLEPNGRLSWAVEECLAVAQVSDIKDPEEVWRRLPRVNSLSPRQRAIAQELGAWRERVAEAENRPIGNVLKDQCVPELAKRQPKNREELGHIRGIGSDVVRKRGNDILEAIQRGLTSEPIRLPEVERLGVEPIDSATIALAESFIRTRALEAGLAYELIASRADLTQIIVASRRGREEPDVRTLRGWRRELVGEELLELLKGEKRLQVGSKGNVEVVSVSS